MFERLYWPFRTEGKKWQGNKLGIKSKQTGICCTRDQPYAGSIEGGQRLLGSFCKICIRTVHFCGDILCSYTGESGTCSRCIPLQSASVAGSVSMGGPQKQVSFAVVAILLVFFFCQLGAVSSQSIITELVFFLCQLLTDPFLHLAKSEDYFIAWVYNTV